MLGQTYTANNIARQDPKLTSKTQEAGGKGMPIIEEEDEEEIMPAARQRRGSWKKPNSFMGQFNVSSN